MDTPLLTIGIQSYKSPDMLKLCINSIKETIGEISCEIIVSDSQTQEDTEMLMREEFPQIHFYPHKNNIGFGALVNNSIKHSHGQFLFLLNADVVVKDDALSELLSYLQKNKDVGIVGPQQQNFNGKPQSTCYRFYHPWTILYRRTPLRHTQRGKRHLAWFLMKDYDQARPRRVDWMMGSALMVRKSAIDKVGLMDSRFFMYMEDVDWCRRFWDNGFNVVFLPSAKIYHYLGKGSAKNGLFRSIFSNKLTWIHISSGIKYFLKYRGKSFPQYNNNGFETKHKQ